jgi:hypothetical protein
MIDAMPRIEFDPWADERIEQIADHAPRSAEVFDRIAFAERALSLVRPAGTTVAVREGQRRVKLDSGRQWGGAPGARWAILSVPHDASRRAIAHAILALGAEGARPWALDVLLAVCDDAPSP